MKKQEVLVLVALGGFAPLLGARVVLAGTPAPAQQQQQPRVSMSDARAAALRAVPGDVVHEQLEHEHGKTLYEFKIRASASPKNAPLKEVKVSADTGTVVGVEDDDGEEDDDR